MAIITTTKRTERFRRTTPPTCKYWLAGRCNRNPCQFSHSLPTSPSNVYYNANMTYKHSKKPDSSVEKIASSSAKKAINCTPKAFKKPENCALKAVECRPEAISVGLASSSAKKAINCAPKALKKPENCAPKAVECRPEAEAISLQIMCVAIHQWVRIVYLSKQLCRMSKIDNTSTIAFLQ